MDSMKAIRSPWNGVAVGAGKSRLASIRSLCKADKQRAKTASPIRVTGTP